MDIFWPMGCKKIKDKAQFEALMSDPRYVAQEKLDGVRVVMHVTSDGSLRFTTRGATLANPDTPIEITHRMVGFNHLRLKGLECTVLDCEAIHPTMSSAEVAGILNYKSTVPVPHGIQLYVFDIVKVKGVDLTDSNFKVRMSYLRAVMAVLTSKAYGFQEVPYYYDTKSKYELLERLFLDGKEGIVLKNLDSLYYQDKKKAGTWYKYKKKDTIDVVIDGSEPPETYYRDPVSGEYDYDRYTKPYEKGWFGSITFHFEDENGVLCYGKTSGFTDEMKDILSTGNHGIKPEYLGRIMEVEYMEKTKDGNLRHPRFVRIREEIEK